MKLLINYANQKFHRIQQLNKKTGIQTAGFDRAICYSPHDIDPDFYQKNSSILSQPRGNGYWLWKPYFIQKSMELLAPGDFLFYSDAGAYFIAPINPLLDICNQTGQEILPFEMQHLERVWTKRDAFILMGCDTPQYTDTNQRLASFILFRKSDQSAAFIHEYLAFAQDERIITDKDNQEGYPNYPEFKTHRHDQSIFSLLAKKYNLKTYRDPSQWGNECKDLFPDSTYPQLIVHTRHQPSEFEKFVRKGKKFLRRIKGRLIPAG